MPCCRSIRLEAARKELIPMIGVVKIGGAEGNRLEPLLSELARRVAEGERWVLAHGASGIMDRFCAERGITVRMITSPSGYRSRFVGEAEREVFEEAAMAYGALIKETLGAAGALSEQLHPAACGSVFAKRKDVLRESVNGRVRILRGNYSGVVASVDGTALGELAKSGVIPIIPPLGLDRESGKAINIDGDRLAAAVAGTLGADLLLILSNVPGLMKDVGDPSSLIREGNLAGWDTLEYYAQGNMKRKIVACREALEARVPRVYLADGREQKPIAEALRGNATCLVR